MHARDVISTPGSRSEYKFLMYKLLTLQLMIRHQVRHVSSPGLCSRNPLPQRPLLDLSPVVLFFDIVFPDNT